MALERCLQEKFDLAEITVNSSPYAVLIYERLGFVVQNEEMVKNGIRFIPMKRVIPDLGSSEK